MMVYPAIDLRGGQCVRLYQGRADQETVYSQNPIDVAMMWKKHGAQYLHIADLDGAFQGQPVHIELAARMKKAAQLPVQLGGGFRNAKWIETALQAGIDRVILGTAAIQDSDMVAQVVARFKDAIAVSIDVADDYVAVQGWKELSSVRFDDLAQRMISLGVQRLLFTDTRKDGTLSGPNVGAIRHFLDVAKVPVIVCGGIGSVDDVVTLRQLGAANLEGVVIGKALYDQRLTLEQALQAVR